MKQRAVRSPSWKYLKNQEFWTYSVFAKGGEPTIFGAAPWLPAPKTESGAGAKEPRAKNLGAEPLPRLQKLRLPILDFCRVVTI